MIRRTTAPRVKRSLFFSTAAVLFAAPAAAQTAPDAPEPDIVVTASGRAQTAASIPFNVSAISEAQLREENITDIKSLIALSPSINAPGNGARFADSVTVRGLNVSPVNANNIEQFARSTIAYYLDDTPLPNIAYRIKDIARVETLLGPQGTLYGAGSLGGTIRYITNKPRFDAVAARLSTSLFAARSGGLSHDTDAMLNVPLADNVAIRIVASRLDDAGYTDRVSNPSWRTGAFAWSTKPDPNRNLYKNDDYNRVSSGRVSLAWEVTDDVKITLAHAQQSQLAHGTSATSLLPLGIANAGGPADIAAYIQDPRFNPCGSSCRFTNPYETPTLAGTDVTVSRYPEFARRNFRLSSVDLDIGLGFADLHSSTSVFRDTRRGEADYAGQGWLFYFGLGDAGAAFDSGRSAFITFDNSYSGVNHETRLTSTGEGPFQWIAGIFYSNTKRNLKFSEFLPGLDAYNGINRAVSGGNVDEGYRENLGSRYEEIAAYGELSYAITPRWTTTVGGRIFNYKDRAISQIRDYSFDLVNNNVDVTRSVKGKAYFKFNTSYKLTEDALAYGTISQGFRRGGTNGFRNVGGLTVNPDVQAFAPDTTTNYEIGVKGRFFQRRLSVDANIYQIDWKDVQTYFSQEINFFPVNGTANGPSARSRGVEATVRVNITDDLSAGFSTAYNDAKWSQTREVCLYVNPNSGCRTYEKGGVLGGSPRWKHSGFVRYDTDLGGDTRGFISLNARQVGAIPIDRSDSPNDVVETFRPYAIVDARIGVKWGQADISLWVENIGNKRSVVSRQPDRVMGNRVFYTQPRTIGLNLSYAL
ncbi:TonB-dependent receptor [Sandaracinobacteroides saxicola]|uniref:TonB-dependent receptor n=1 Tax=Sandaracinobacteroides saxicola TaxID=2759707 RepID=A0A7G5IIE0_9SPHN|nr:TonB-dependent receptor [Sandaracinobacteroides saxicola]QMW23132.1 TonB-dependent receptor [Sandaracinobacteroides saxicola]